MKNIKELNIDSFREGTLHDELSARDQRALKSGFSNY